MAEIKKYLDQVALGALVDQIKAEDAKVKAYVDKHIEDAGKTYDVAGAAATAESNAKTYTDALANGQVATNKADIAKLNGDANTDGSVAKAIADAKALIDADIAAVDAIADQNAADIEVLEGKVQGLIEGTYDDTEIRGLITANAEAIETLGETHATDKEALEDAIALKADQTALDAVSLVANAAVKQSDYDVKVAALDAEDARVAGLVTAEAERAAGIEAGLRTDVDAIKGDYLKGEDKTELEASIKSNADAIALLTNGVDPETVDGVNDLIAYVAEHGTEVTGMKEDISDNAEAIAGVASRMDTAEGKITAVEGAVATKAEKTYVDEQVEALQGADTGLGNRITALENKFGEGEGSVEDMIAAAQAAAEATASADATAKANQALADANSYTDGEIDKVEATITTLTETVGTKAAQSDLTALTSRVTTAEGEIDTLQSEMDAVEAKAAANETAISGLQTAVNGKVAQGDFDNAVARIAQNETDIAALEEASATHALASDLTDAVARIAQNETAIAANTSAINSFTAITADEVNAMFA